MQRAEEQATHYEHIILGGGLAGSTLALAMARRGVKPALIHANQQQSPETASASLVPLALYNPAAAMKARMGWQAVKCDKALKALIAELDEFCGGTESFVKQNGVLRPCLDKQMQKNFQKSLEQNDWPEGWVSWKTPEELKSAFPGVVHQYGGLWVPAAKTFNMPVMLESLHRMLEEKYGIEIIEAEVQELKALTQDDRKQAGWQLKAVKPSPENHISHGEYGEKKDAGTETITLNYTARSVVAATGSRLPVLLKDFLPGLFKVHRVKGQTLRVPRPVPDAFGPSVASKGYIALFGEQAVVGSTYEHHFEESEALATTEEARDRLQAKVERTFTGSEAHSQHDKNTSQWAGIRLTTPDRLPLLGALPKYEGLFISAGFGSKGLMYSSYCAELMAEYMISGRRLPFDVDIRRQLPPDT
jgi:glycine/D-amino acid oxidase-like deaminating enzyme